MNEPIENRLSAIRQARGISASRLAAKVGVSRQTIYAIEAGSYMPNTVLALKLSRELGVSVEELFSLAGGFGEREETLSAVLLSAVPETGGPVRLAKTAAGWICVPSTPAPYYLPVAEGLITGGRGRSRVRLLNGEEAFEKRLVIAGCDPAISLLARAIERLSGVEVVTAPAASRLALEWLRKGWVHVAGSHLEDPATGEFNVPYLEAEFPGDPLAVVTFARWEEGFVVGKGNPLRIRSVDDLARPSLRFVNREQGSGSRALLDRLLARVGLRPDDVSGYDSVAFGHLAAAYQVVSGKADACLATPSAARAFGLDFLPIHQERFDLILRKDHLDIPAVRAMTDALQRATLRRQLESLAGYDTAQTGSVVRSAG